MIISEGQARTILNAFKELKGNGELHNDIIDIAKELLKQYPDLERDFGDVVK
jgi:hypothetical protein